MLEIRLTAYVIQYTIFYPQLKDPFLADISTQKSYIDCILIYTNDCLHTQKTITRMQDFLLHIFV